MYIPRKIKVLTALEDAPEELTDAIEPFMVEFDMELRGDYEPIMWTEDVAELIISRIVVDYAELLSKEIIKECRKSIVAYEKAWRRDNLREETWNAMDGDREYRASNF